MREGIDQLDQRPARLAHQRQRAAEQDRHQQHLQHVAVGKGAEHGVGDQLEQEVDRALVFHLGGVVDKAGNGRRIQRARIHVHADAGLEHISQEDAQRQRDGGDDLEVHHRLDADAADLLQLAGAADAGHHHAEHDRADQHLDQLDKGVAERLELGGEFGKGKAECGADHQGDQHLAEQRAGKAGVQAWCARAVLRGNCVLHGCLRAGPVLCMCAGWPISIQESPAAPCCSDGWVGCRPYVFGQGSGSGARHRADSPPVGAESTQSVVRTGLSAADCLNVEPNIVHIIFVCNF
ncbi:hypothetical protein D9M72_502450 [compost metagenome]